MNLDTYVQKMIYGPVSKDLYVISSNGAQTKTSFLRLNASYEEVVKQAYDVRNSQRSYAIDTSETYLYAIRHHTSSLILDAYSTTDFSHIGGKKSDDYKCNSEI